MPPEHPPRQIPAPWRIVEVSDGPLAIEDAAGQRLVYIYHAEGSRRSATGAMSREDAERLAAWIVRLPDLARAGREG